MRGKARLLPLQQEQIQGMRIAGWPSSQILNQSPLTIYWRWQECHSTQLRTLPADAQNIL